MFKLFAVSCLIVAAFAEPVIIESGIPVVKTVVQQPGTISVVQQPGTVSVQKHTIENQHVHGTPTGVSSHRQTIVQKSVSHLNPNVAGSTTVIKTPSIVGSHAVIGTPSLISSPSIVQSYHSPISRATVLQSQPAIVSHL